MSRFGKMERFEKGGHGKIWQDLTRETCQDWARFGKIWQDLTRGAWQDLARFGKIWQDLTRGDMARFDKILANRRCQELARCGKI